MCRNEGSFPTPLEYIDVVRRTNPTLHVLLESRIDDDWNVDGGRELSEPWPDFTQFTTLKNFQMDTRGPGRGIKQHQGPIIYGHRYGQECLKLLNKSKRSIGLLKNRSSMFPEK